MVHEINILLMLMMNELVPESLLKLKLFKGVPGALYSLT